MKAQIKLLTLAFAALTLVTSVACSHSSGSDPSSPTASGLSISPNPASVAEGQSILITPSGGTGPYSFSLLSIIGGTLSVPSGNSTLFTAGSSTGIVQLTVTDSVGLSGQIQITVTPGAAGSFQIAPLTTTVVPGGTVTFSATGGSGTYTYSVLSGGGSFNVNVFTAPATAQVVTVLISDSAGHSAQTTVTVSGGTTSAQNCAGNYSLNLTGYPGTLTIIEDSSGNIAGYLALTGYGFPAAISGTCASGTINFTDLYSQSVFTGTYGTISGTNQIVMTGTFTGGNSWFAIHQ